MKVPMNEMQYIPTDGGVVYKPNTRTQDIIGGLLTFLAIGLIITLFSLLSI